MFTTRNVPFELERFNFQSIIAQILGEILPSNSPVISFDPEAVTLLLITAENFLIKLFRCAKRVAHNSRRKTVTIRDIYVVWITQHQSNMSLHDHI